MSQEADEAKETWDHPYLSQFQEYRPHECKECGMMMDWIWVDGTKHCATCEVVQ